MIAQKIVKTTGAIDLDIKGITLLSIEEYKACKEHIKHTNNYWWLRSPGLDNDGAAVVSGGGSVNHSGLYVNVYFGVRPALEINIKSSELQIGDEVYLMNYRWTVISDKLILCDEIIAELPSHKDWKVNDYNKSSIKQWLEDWYAKQTKTEDRREAIRILNESNVINLASGDTKGRQAVDLAIEALEREIEYGQTVIDYTKGEALKSGDWECANTPTDTPTNDCISRQQAIEAIEDVDWYHVNSKGELVSGATSVKEAWYRAEDIYEALEPLKPVTPPSKVLVTIKVDTEELVERVKEEYQLKQEHGGLIDVERREL